MLNEKEARELVKLLRKAGKDVDIDSKNGYIIISDDCMIEESMVIDIQHLTNFSA